MSHFVRTKKGAYVNLDLIATIHIDVVEGRRHVEDKQYDVLLTGPEGDAEYVAGSYRTLEEAEAAADGYAKSKPVVEVVT